MHLNNYDARHRKAAWKARSEGHEQRIIRNMEKFFSNCDPSQPEAPVLGKAADAVPHTTCRRARRFLRDDFEGEYITVVSGLLPNRARKELVLES